MWMFMESRGCLRVDDAVHMKYDYLHIYMDKYKYHVLVLIHV